MCVWVGGRVGIWRKGGLIADHTSNASIIPPLSIVALRITHWKFEEGFCFFGSKRFVSRIIHDMMMMMMMMMMFIMRRCGWDKIRFHFSAIDTDDKNYADHREMTMMMIIMNVIMIVMMMMMMTMIQVKFLCNRASTTDLNFAQVQIFWHSQSGWK